MVVKVTLHHKRKCTSFYFSGLPYVTMALSAGWPPAMQFRPISKLCTAECITAANSNQLLEILVSVLFNYIGITIIPVLMKILDKSILDHQKEATPDFILHCLASLRESLAYKQPSSSLNAYGKLKRRKSLYTVECWMSKKHLTQFNILTSSINSVLLQSMAHGGTSKQIPTKK